MAIHCGNEDGSQKKERENEKGRVGGEGGRRSCKVGVTMT